MATKKMVAKKMATKKPAATMKKTSPVKQTKSTKNVDDAEMTAYKISQGRAKDARVAAHRQNLQNKDRDGYTNSQIDLYKTLAMRGNYSMGGASYNFLTGQGGITEFDKKYVPSSNANATGDRVLTKDGKKQISKSNVKYSGNDDNLPSQSYLNEKAASKMNTKQYRKQFINDSIRTQERKEEHLNIAQNYGRVASLYGLQPSQIMNSISGQKKKVKK